MTEKIVINYFWSCWTLVRAFCQVSTDTLSRGRAFPVNGAKCFFKNLTRSDVWGQIPFLSKKSEDLMMSLKFRLCTHGVSLLHKHTLWPGLSDVGGARAGLVSWGSFFYKTINYNWANLLKFPVKGTFWRWTQTLPRFFM